jgi:hypothetical protein
MARGDCGLASRAQGETNQGVVVVGVALWRQVGGEQSSPELGKRAAVEGCRQLGSAGAIYSPKVSRISNGRKG